MAELIPIGDLIQINNYRLHAYQLGEGNPTVVFVSGVGNDCLIWQLVQPEVARFTSTLSYDRAGLGWSDATENPRSSEFIASELHDLLSKTNTKPPYVMVGHSMGGIHIRKYAEIYPHNVAGLVLIDSPHEELNMRLPQRVQEADRAQEQAMIGQMRQMLELMDRMEHSEYVEYFKAPPDQPQPFPDDVVALRRDRVRPKAVRAMIEEVEAMETNISQHWDRKAILGTKPVIILIGEEIKVNPTLTDEENHLAGTIVKETQQELLILSENSRTMTVSDSSHFIQVDQPQIVIDTIRELVDQLKV